jgi:hypothetical protein
LAVGLIFMIVALSGRLPTRLKIGENEAEWQDFAGNVIETAVDASPPSVKAELAPQLAELAEVAPRAAVPALSGLAYESSIAQIVAVAALKIPDVEHMQVGVTLEDAQEFDLVIQATGNRFILVETKASRRLYTKQAVEIIKKAHSYRQAYPDRKTALLLVSRYRVVTDPIRDLFKATPNATYIVFRDKDDEPKLIGAINGLLSDLGRAELHTVRERFPEYHASAPSRGQRSGQRVDDATGRVSASETTARATATAAGWFAARTVTMLMIWLAVCALTMLAALADAACSAATANSAGFRWSPPSLSTVMVTS